MVDNFLPICRLVLYDLSVSVLASLHKNIYVACSVGKISIICLLLSHEPTSSK